MNVASLLVPALRWDAAHGFEYLRDFIDEALELGVGGFLIFGGTRQSVRTLAADLHERSRYRCCWHRMSSAEQDNNSQGVSVSRRSLHLASRATPMFCAAPRESRRAS